MISRRAILRSIVARIIFRPPLVDPAVAPMAIRISSISFGNSCQEPQSAVLYPVLVMMLVSGNAVSLNESLKDDPANAMNPEASAIDNTHMKK